MENRRLATILVADLVGYSRLVAEHEEETIRAFQMVLATILKPSVQDAGGRIFKTMGDGFLAEFVSPEKAIRCAISIQDRMAEREPMVCGSLLLLRIGVNMGDIIDIGGDLFGDSVNIASRLESIASPGGVCVSGALYDTIKGKTETKFSSIGMQNLKNIPDQVEVWQSEKGVAEQPRRAPVAGRPSVAVLPFDNLSSDPDQEFFAEGLVEDITTELSRFASLLVVARSSTLAYRQVHRDLRSIGQELGVDYVVEGTLRRSGHRLRITAQLIATETGLLVWSNRWNRNVSDIFDVQDEITKTIVGILEPEIRRTEIAHSVRKTTPELTAWELMHRGCSALYEWTYDGSERAKVHFAKAIKADEDFADPYGWMAVVYAHEIVYMTTTDVEESLTLGVDYAQKCLAFDANNEFAQYALGIMLAVTGAVDDALARLNSAIEKNPNNAYLFSGRALARQYEPEPSGKKIAEDAAQALRLSPNGEGVWSFFFFIAFGRLLEDSEDKEGLALQALENACNQINPGFPAFVLAAIVATRTDIELAERRLKQAMSLLPDLKASSLRVFWDDPAWKKFMSNSSEAIDALVVLGLPAG